VFSRRIPPGTSGGLGKKKFFYPTLSRSGRVLVVHLTLFYMKKVFFVFFNCMFLTGIIKAQGPAKAVYFELGGPGLASFNVDMRFANGEKGLGARAGIGGFSLGDMENRVTAIFVPLVLNYIISKDEKNYLEIGAGTTAVILRAGDSRKENRFSANFNHIDIAYRLQPKNGGFFFRAAFTPIFNKNFFWPYYGGVSLGYKF
jgi:hypothetical protein